MWGLWARPVCVVAHYMSPSEDAHHLSKHQKVLNKTPGPFSKLSLDLLFHSGSLSTPPALISPLSCDSHDATCVLVAAADPCCAAAFLNASDPF